MNVRIHKSDFTFEDFKEVDRIDRAWDGDIRLAWDDDVFTERVINSSRITYIEIRP